MGGREMCLSQGHRGLSSVGAVMLTYQVGEVPGVCHVILYSVAVITVVQQMFAASSLSKCKAGLYFLVPCG